MTGGGSISQAIDELAKSSLKIPARVATSRDLRDQSWSVACGLCLLGGDPEPEESLGVRIARETTLGFLRWLKPFLP